MREEKRAVSMTHTVYVADDGAEFDNRDDCVWHETEVRQHAAEEKIAHLLHFNLFPVGAGMLDDDPDWIWYKASSEDDLNAIMDAHFEKDADARAFRAAKFPVWVVVTSDGTGYGSIESYDEYVEHTRRHLEALDQIIKEEENEG